MQLPGESHGCIAHFTTNCRHCDENHSGLFAARQLCRIDLALVANAQGFAYDCITKQCN